MPKPSTELVAACTDPHSPDPWVIDPRCPRGVLTYIDTADHGTAICAVNTHRRSPDRNGDPVPDPTGLANLRRIVAEHNACQGIPTAALEAGCVKAGLDACALAVRLLDSDGKNSASPIVIAARAALAAAGR